MTTNKVTTTKAIRYGIGTAAAAVGIVVLAACASSSHKASAGAGGGATTGSTSGLRTQSTSIGTVAADSSGHTLYELAGDTAGNPMCTAGCLSVWPAVMSGGTQVVLHGHPAFTFAMDSASGQVNGQAVTDQWGTWYALDSNGNPITGKAPAGGASSKSSGGGGGYGY